MTYRIGARDIVGDGLRDARLAKDRRRMGWRHVDGKVVVLGSGGPAQMVLHVQHRKALLADNLGLGDHLLAHNHL